MKFSLNFLVKTLIGVALVGSCLWTLGMIYPSTQLFTRSAGGQLTKVSSIAVQQAVSRKNPGTLTFLVDTEASASKPPQKPAKKMALIVLGSKNTIAFREAVTSKSVAKLQRKLIDMSFDLPKHATIYLVLNSPGGSISAGNRFIDTVKAIPQRVKTISLFSASMAYHWVQNLDERLVVPSSVLMSHRARISGLRGEVPGEAVTRLNWVIRELEDMDRTASARLGMTFEEYREMIRDEYWVGGKDAVAQNSADRAVLVRCGRSLKGTEEIEMRTFFGKVMLTYSKCPIITAPLGIKFKKSKKSTKLNSFVNSFVNDKKGFVKEYILTDKYRDFLK